MSDHLKLTDKVLDCIIVSVPDSNGLLRIDMSVIEAIRALRDVAMALEHSRRPLVNSDDVYGFRQSVEVEWLDALADLLPEPKETQS